MRVPNHVQLFILLDFSGHLDVLFLSICGICALQDLRTGRINMVYSLRQQGTPYFLFAFLRGKAGGRRGLTSVDSNNVATHQSTTHDRSGRPPSRASLPRSHARDRSCTHSPPRTAPFPVGRVAPPVFVCAAPNLATRCAASHSAARYTPC